MKLSKFIFLVFFITFLFVLYVWQQAEVFRLAYAGERDRAFFQELLDKNSRLRYDLKKNTSLIRIGNKIYESADFMMPDNYLLVKPDLSAQETVAAVNRPLLQK